MKKTLLCHLFILCSFGWWPRFFITRICVKLGCLIEVLSKFSKLKTILLLASLEAAYSLIWGAQEILGKGGGETLALL